RALELAHGALLGEPRITPEEIRRRVASRYPEAEELPDRPALDRLLSEAGWNFAWDETDECYVREEPEQALSTLSSSLRRASTSTGGAPGEVSVEVAEARQFEERLQHAHREGAFLALTVAARFVGEARQELLHRFDLECLSMDGLLLQAMREVATENEVEWDLVLAADALPEGPDRANLMFLVNLAADRVAQDLLRRVGSLLLTHLGLLARYDRMELLEKLRDVVGRKGHPHNVWLLIPGDEVRELPAVDGRPVPLISSGQRARIPTAWLRNLHRGKFPVAPRHS
ncbi:MAG: BREX system serine/threonine kinase PglW, partial [Candidatus Eremiobacterota bacterium]